MTNWRQNSNSFLKNQIYFKKLELKIIEIIICIFFSKNESKPEIIVNCKNTFINLWFQRFVPILIGSTKYLK